MNNPYKQNKLPRSASLYRLISAIRSVEKRNLLRGYSAGGALGVADINAIRHGASPHDSAIIGAFLKGPSGVLDNLKSRKKTSKDLYRLTAISKIGWRSELFYTIGYLNSSSEIAGDILDFIKKLVCIDVTDPERSLNVLLEMAKVYGASNFLSYKLAYLRSSFPLSSTESKLISDIEREIEHRSHAGMHFSALENVSSKISLFLVAQRRVSGLVGKVKDGEFRRALSLSNFIPTPLNEDDLAGFLLRATESSLVDTVYAILVILNLDAEFDDAQAELKRGINSDLFAKISEVLRMPSVDDDSSIVTNYYKLQSPGVEASLSLYRVSSAFLEHRKFARFRCRMDRVFGVRLLAEIINGRYKAKVEPFADKDILLLADNVIVGDEQNVVLDVFYRTYLFLRFIEDRLNIIRLSRDEVKYILENTLSLDSLLAEDEIRALYLTVPEVARSFVAVLALALFKAKSIDPDVDFEFRTDFISHVRAEHGGSIVKFIEYLLVDSPEVASYIVRSLDEVTLEKMYTLIENASQASEIRSEMLRAIGQNLGRIEYIIEADAITTRSKVSRLQQYFDNSRMYVDSVAMKKWLDANPSVATEQYRSLHSEWNAYIAETDADSTDRKIYLIELFHQNEYLILEIATEAFEQFCLNPEFGIQSYLGRRIRHNTLDGVTTDTVDAVLRKSEFGVILSNFRMRRTVDAWVQVYKEIIDKLRREHLQFKSSGSLFNATLDSEDSTTKENLRNLIISLQAAGRSELLNELVIAFCWKQITPQLENAARFIRTKLLQEAYASIDKAFSGTFGVVEEQLKSDLHDAVNGVFKKIADWFQVPQTGFVPASVSDLCQIILMELNRENHVEFFGKALEQRYTGITVHRLYDCLAALLKNAQKYGEEGTKIRVEVTAIRGQLSDVLEHLTVDITSTVAEGEFSRCKSRIESAIDSAETGVDMVTEGYTGIKKVKFITRGCEGAHTVRLKSCDDERELTLSFSLHAEIAHEDVANGEGL